MTVDDYTGLTGIDVPSSRVAAINAQLQRAQVLLESMLGFTLDPDKTKTNLYNELGKSPVQGSWGDLVTEDLLPADAVENAYRLFPFNEKDKYLHLDPFSAIHAVKLVHNGVTVFTFEGGDYRVQYGRDGWAKFIAPEYSLLSLQVTFVSALNWFAALGRSFQLAVDADWLWGLPSSEPDDYAFTEVPTDLQLIMTDIASFYADSKRQVKSQTVGSHSFTRDITAPETMASNLAILQRYAGPYGSVTPTVTV